MLGLALSAGWERGRSFVRNGLLLAAVAGMFSGCSQSNGYVQNKFGEHHYAKGNYAQARNDFARAVADSPDNADYRYNLAMSLQKLGDPSASERILRHNLSIDMSHQPTYHALAQSLNESGRSAEAQEVLTAWVQTQPYIPEAHVEMAWLQKQLGDVAGAQQSLQYALKEEPGHPVALAQLGQLYQSQGQPQLAARMYEQSLAADGSQSEVRSALAMAHEQISRGARMNGGPQLVGPMPQASANIAYSQPMMTSPQMVSSQQVMPSQQIVTGYQIMNGPVVTSLPQPSQVIQPASLNQTPVIMSAQTDVLEIPPEPTMLPPGGTALNTAAPASANGVQQASYSSATGPVLKSARGPALRAQPADYQTSVSTAGWRPAGQPSAGGWFPADPAHNFVAGESSDMAALPTLEAY